jgi:CheY-like chemotaxis protein
MSRKLNCIMLIDDNPHDNFFHEREIKKFNSDLIILVKNSGIDALNYLKSDKNNDGQHPDLIFLDINMPCMNGWEFLEEYGKLDKKLQGQAVVTMLTTSQNPDDKARAKAWGFLFDYITKPLTQDAIKNIFDKYFFDADGATA